MLFGVGVLYYVVFRRSDSNRAVQPQKMAIGLKFWIMEVEGMYFFYVAKIKALISCVATTQLICTIVFAHVKGRFSHDEAHLQSGC